MVISALLEYDLFAGNIGVVLYLWLRDMNGEMSCCADWRDKSLDPDTQDPGGLAVDGSESV